MGIAAGALPRLAAAAGPLPLLAASAFVAGRPPPVAAAAALHLGVDADASGSCASNSTHVGWILDDGRSVSMERDEARSEMAAYLWRNVMPYDVSDARALGFDPDSLGSTPGIIERGESSLTGDGGGALRSVSRAAREGSAVDGLSDGVLNQTLHYALEAKARYPWTDAIPRSVYLEYVAPYAVVNEPRTDHRQLLFDAVDGMLAEYQRTDGPTVPKLRGPAPDETPREQIKEAVRLINTRLWSALGRESSPIVFRAGLTPRIYDPLSVVAYGHSSCTGLAILLASALRSAGIPARMAGTPAWHGNDDEGNHGWVEAYVPGDGAGGKGEWAFLEPTPGIAEGQEDAADADDLDRDPCKRWFCQRDRFDGSTRTYATRFDRVEADATYPMAWAVGDDGVPGLDRSDYYNEVCGKCGQ